jgi:putative endonuclease
MTRRSDGRYWEERVCEYLERHGLKILWHGYRCRFGELDLVCADGDTLTIVEVRSRAAASVVSALETVDATKRRKLVQTTRHLLMRYPEWAQRPLRFDIVAIDGSDTPDARYAWIKNAFDTSADG